MSRERKILLAILLVLFLICSCCGGVCLLGAWTMRDTIIADEAGAQEVGQEIATYTLPDGYTEVTAMRMLTTKLVVIAKKNAGSGDMLIMLMQVADSDSLDPQLLEDQLQIVMRQQSTLQQLNLGETTTEKRTINGQSVTVKQRTGSDAAGTPYRQMSLLIDTDTDPVFVLVQGAESKWDEEALDSLLESIE